MVFNTIAPSYLGMAGKTRILYFRTQLFMSIYVKVNPIKTLQEVLIENFYPGHWGGR